MKPIGFFRNLFSQQDGQQASQQASRPTASETKNVTTGGNPWGDLQAATDARETYEQAEQYGRPRTFVEENRWMLPVSRFGIIVGHTISLATLLGFITIGAYRWSGVEIEGSTINWVIFSAYLASLGTLAVLVELYKMKGEQSLFDAAAFKRRVPHLRALKVSLAVIASLVISAYGAWMAGVKMTSKAADIRAAATANVGVIDATFHSDSTEIRNRQARRKQQIREALKTYRGITPDNPFLKRVAWSSHQFTKGDYKLSPAGRQKIADLEDELSQLENNSLAEIKALRQERAQAQDANQDGMYADLQEDERRAEDYALIAVLIAIGVEIVSLVCHGMLAAFMKGAYVEGQGAGLTRKPVDINPISLADVIAHAVNERRLKLEEDLARMAQLGYGWQGTNPPTQPHQPNAPQPGPQPRPRIGFNIPPQNPTVQGQGEGAQVPYPTREEMKGWLEEMLENRNGSGDTVPPSHSEGTVPPSNFQPESKAKRSKGHRVEHWESRNAIKAAFLGMVKAGEYPAQAKVAEITGISSRTVGKHLREMWRDGELQRYKRSDF